ncbi:CPBP family glutamic-type intramembrane protease [Trinickia fusca]|uniref:CPBP family intramembrane metalloprotease n=1 Tax=Trinickia fusca TaxID=2419777 RepID=A0A494XJC1_9BURK|nr:CPBP family glutamic-type intramembrane protease [Trinickia fusca]RKP47663.1 CPBP family intramembrane metalloprotease [Trinickia fusca]
MLAISYIMVFGAVPAAWRACGSSVSRWLGLGLLVVGYAIALAIGLLGPLSMVGIGLLVLAAVAVQPQRRRYVRYLGHAMFIALAIALDRHWLPGFHNLRVIAAERLTPDAVPFTMYLNLDKPLVGFWLLLVIPWIHAARGWRASLISGVVGWVVATLSALLIARWLGMVAWEPKWPQQSALWLINNLLLVAVTEEVFFRGYVQGGLRRLLAHRGSADLLALLISAALFGLEHVSGGGHWIVLAGVAGVVYGLAYRFGGLPASILAHFGLDAVHFFLFSYPMLAASVR